MSYTDSLLLGLLQGLTEFLPVSSSGHLVLGQALLGIHQQGIYFEVALHAATGLAVVIFYRSRLWRMAEALPLAFSPRHWSAEARTDERTAGRISHLLLVCYLLVGTFPAALLGVAFKDRIEEAFGSPRLVCVMLAVTGAVLITTAWTCRRSAGALGWRVALVIGLAQAAALLPGISRSGSTIAAALALGIQGEKAAEFSFLLAIPAIFGAAALEVLGLAASGGALSLDWVKIIAGALAAFVSGYLALAWLLKTIRKGKLHRFAYYCWALAAFGLAVM